MRIDPLEELRELEGIARRQTGRRGILVDRRAARDRRRTRAPAHCSSTHWASIEVDVDHRSLAGVAAEHMAGGADRRLRRGRRPSGRAVSSMDVTEATFEHDVVARSAGDACARRLLGRLVRPLSRSRSRARGGGRGATGRRHPREGRRRREPGALAAVLRQRHPGGEGVPRRPRRRRVRGSEVARRPSTPSSTSSSPRRGPTPCSRSSAPAGELPEVVAALDAGDIEGALAAHRRGRARRRQADERERLREIAVALFERLGADDPLVGTYRRRLAAALY